MKTDDSAIAEVSVQQPRAVGIMKDVRLMLAATPLHLPLSETHRQLLEKAVALGHGDLDNRAIIVANWLSNR